MEKEEKFTEEEKEMISSVIRVKLRSLVRQIVYCRLSCGRNLDCKIDKKCLFLGYKKDFDICNQIISKLKVML